MRRKTREEIESGNIYEAIRPNLCKYKYLKCEKKIEENFWVKYEFKCSNDLKTWDFIRYVSAKNLLQAFKRNRNLEISNNVSRLSRVS